MVGKGSVYHLHTFQGIYYTLTLRVRQAPIIEQLEGKHYNYIIVYNYYS